MARPITACRCSRGSDRPAARGGVGAAVVSSGETGAQSAARIPACTQGMVAHVDLPVETPMDGHQLRQALNAFLPSDIRVMRAVRAGGFSCAL